MKRQYLYSIIGLEATKKLMSKAAGEKISIHAHCSQPYKKQYILDPYDGTRRRMIEIIRTCKTTQRYVYKGVEGNAKGKKK